MSMLGWSWADLADDPTVISNHHITKGKKILS